MRRSRSSAAPPPGSAAVKRGVANEDETISLESLSCPILAKIWHAFNYAKKAVYAETDGDMGPGSKILRGGTPDKRHVTLPCDTTVWELSRQWLSMTGKWDATINMVWDEKDMALIVAFRVCAAVAAVPAPCLGTPV